MKNEYYKVLANTENMQREDWLALRGKGIGGSDVGTIVGANKYKSAFALWAEKTGKIVNEFKGNEATQWGHDLELIVAQRFAQKTGKSVVAWPVMLQSTRWEFMRANLDFLIMTDEGDNGEWKAGEVTTYTGKNELPYDRIEAILEIKTSGIVGRGSLADWQDDGVPKSYELQGAHYSLVTGIQKVVFGALVAGEGLVIRNRFYEEDDLEMIAYAEINFWECVVNDFAPDPDGSETTHKAITAMFPVHQPLKKVEASEEVAKAFFQWQTAKEQADDAERIASQYRAILELAIGDGEALTHNGKTLFTYKATSPKPAFDAKAFQEANPELYEQFLRPRSGYRVLRPAKD